MLDDLLENVRIMGLVLSKCMNDGFGAVLMVLQLQVEAKLKDNRMRLLSVKAQTKTSNQDLISVEEIVRGVIADDRMGPTVENVSNLVKCTWESLISLHNCSNAFI